MELQYSNLKSGVEEKVEPGHNVSNYKRAAFAKSPEKRLTTQLDLGDPTDLLDPPPVTLTHFLLPASCPGNWARAFQCRQLWELLLQVRTLERQPRKIEMAEAELLD